MTRYRHRPSEVQARQVPASDPTGSFLEWTSGRRALVRVNNEPGTAAIDSVTIEQLGDFPQHCFPGDYIVFHPDERAEKVRRHVFERNYVRCG